MFNSDEDSVPIVRTTDLKSLDGKFELLESPRLKWERRVTPARISTHSVLGSSCAAVVMENVRSAVENLRLQPFAMRGEPFSGKLAIEFSWGTLHGVFRLGRAPHEQPDCFWYMMDYWQLRGQPALNLQPETCSIGCSVDSHTPRLSDLPVDDAASVIREQLSRAGVDTSTLVPLSVDIGDGSSTPVVSPALNFTLSFNPQPKS